MLAPAFVDPHVHLRTPGREDEETIATGTAAAAAGGYCAILAMPNTDPVVDTPTSCAACARRAEAEARVPVGFTAAITIGQDGTQLTEMGELADAGAAAFTDDGRPVATAGLMRRALEYNAITGRRLSLHCEEPTLTRGGHMHMGAVSAELGLGGWPVARREPRRLTRALARRRHPAAAPPDAPLGPRVGRAARAPPGPRASQASGEVTPHHLSLTDEAVRSLDPNLKMNPPLRTAADRAALLEALVDGTIEAIATDHAPHSREEKDVPFEAAPFGVTGLETAFAALNTLARPAGPARPRDAARADVGRPGPDLRARAAADRRRGAARTSSCSAPGDLERTRGRLPLPLGELLAPRAQAPRAAC